MTEAGEPYCYLKGCAYLLRTEGNRELIAAIEGGIKKEVSVGCAVERSVCSICGEEFHTCPHEKGAEYGGTRRGGGVGGGAGCIFTRLFLAAAVCCFLNTQHSSLTVNIPLFCVSTHLSKENVIGKYFAFHGICVFLKIAAILHCHPDIH